MSQQLSLDAVDQYVKVNVDQFHGIEIEEWPAQIAKTAMWLMDHQMNIAISKEFGNAFVRIPLVKSANIVHGNALQLDWTQVIAPAQCSYILGNPPFRGYSFQSPTQKQLLRRSYHEARSAGKLDFVTAWFAKATAYMQHHPAIETAFVATNSITQGEQVSILWSALYAQGAHINFAHRTFEWRSEASGAAAVHCVIIGFALQPRSQKLLYDYEHVRAEAICREVAQINPYLVDGPEVFLAYRREPLSATADIMVKGSQPTDGGHFLLSFEEKQEISANDPIAARYIRPFMGAKELISGERRWCFWLAEAKPQDLRASKILLQRIAAVKRTRLTSHKAKTRMDAQKPSEFQEIRQPTSEYLAIPSVSSERRLYVPIGYLSAEVIASNLLLIIPNASRYTFGVMCSLMHNAWMRVVCGRLKSDYRYSASIVYNNFPWPEPTNAQRQQIEKTAQAILDARANHPEATLADLYDPLAMPHDLRKAHQANDRAVDAAYGKHTFTTEAQRVGFLFQRYQSLA